MTLKDSSALSAVLIIAHTAAATSRAWVRGRARVWGGGGKGGGGGRMMRLVCAAACVLPPLPPCVFPSAPCPPAPRLPATSPCMHARGAHREEGLAVAALRDEQQHAAEGGLALGHLARERRDGDPLGNGAAAGAQGAGVSGQGNERGKGGVGRVGIGGGAGWGREGERGRGRAALRCLGWLRTSAWARADTGSRMAGERGVASGGLGWGVDGGKALLEGGLTSL